MATPSISPPPPPYKRSRTPSPSSSDAQRFPSLPSRASSRSSSLHERPISITVTHGGESRTFSFEEDAVLDDLVAECEGVLGPDYDWPAAKFIAPPPSGLLKAADKADTPLTPLAGKKLHLLATKVRDISALRAAEQAMRHMREARLAQRRAARRPRSSQIPRPSDQQQSEYTFQAMRPLAGLPRPERSLAFLQRLASDPGIVSAMRRHKFRVGLLTEMDPASYTESSHEGTTRILGLNRNAGEAIELRLRTDAYDGYRDYRTIRRTLCHELAHNVHGDHDRKFWDLCHQIEREVDRADYTAHGRTLDGGDYSHHHHHHHQHRHHPAQHGGEEEEEEGLLMDHGGWTGGSYVLGTGEAPPPPPPPSSSGPTSLAPTFAATTTTAPGPGAQPLSRRDIIAKAVEERLKRMNEDRPDGGSTESRSRSRSP